MTSSKQKWLTAWLALIAGPFGAHRFYLFGARDIFAWVHIPFSLAGLTGVVRMRNLGQDDVVSWFLIPLLGISMAAACLGGIVYGLMADEKFNVRFNSGASKSQMSWVVVFAVVACLLLGGTVTMATFAFSFQKFFEWQIEAAKKTSS